MKASRQYILGLGRRKTISAHFYIIQLKQYTESKMSMNSEHLSPYFSFCFNLKKIMFGPPVIHPTRKVITLFWLETGIARCESLTLGLIIRLLVCLLVSLLVCMIICLSFYSIPVCSFCTPDCLTKSLSVCLSIRLSVRVSKTHSTD